MPIPTDIRQRYLEDMNRSLTLRMERQVVAVTQELVEKFNVAPTEARAVAERIVAFVLGEIAKRNFSGPSPF